MGSDDQISRPTPRDFLPPERLHFLRGPPFSKLTDYQVAIFHIQIAAETTGVLSSLSKDSTGKCLVLFSVLRAYLDILRTSIPCDQPE